MRDGAWSNNPVVPTQAGHRPPGAKKGDRKMKEIMAGVAVGSATGIAIISASDGDAEVIAYALLATAVIYIAGAVINEYQMRVYHKRICESEDGK